MTEVSNLEHYIHPCTELCQASLCCYEIFTHQFDRIFFSCIQGVTGRFVLFCYKNQNPGQSCHPSIDLTMVLKQKLDKDFKKVGTNRGEVIHLIIHNYWKFIEEFWAFFASNWVRKQNIVNCRMDYLIR